MGGQSSAIKNAAVWIALVAAAAVVLALSILPSRSGPAPTRVAEETVEQSPGESPGKARSSDSAAAWGQSVAAQDILVRAEDVAQLHGLMSLEEGPDNEGAGSAEPPKVAYVWCEDDGQADHEDEEEPLDPPADEHLAVFELNVPDTRTYYPWARIWWQDGCGNSIILALEREGASHQQYVVQDGTLEWWHWLPTTGEAGLQLERGTYRLMVKNREDGARLSRVLFCTRSYALYKPETPEG